MSAAFSQSKPAAVHAAAKCCGLRREARIERADREARHRAGVRDHARRADRRRDVRDAAQHLVVARGRALQDRRAVDAVLERDRRRRRRRAAARAPAPSARRPRASRRTSPRRPGRPARIALDGTRRRDGEVASRAFDRRPCRRHRVEVPAARDERDVVARLREPAAEVSTDAAGADHCDLHGSPYANDDVGAPQRGARERNPAAAHMRRPFRRSLNSGSCPACTARRRSTPM